MKSRTFIGLPRSRLLHDNLSTSTEKADKLCQQNKIPVFCPALTDGSLGDMLWTHSYKTETPLIVDLVSDIRRLNDLSLSVKKAGMIILGGGVCKHQIANSMLFVRRFFVCTRRAFLNAWRNYWTEKRCRLRGLRQHRPRIRRQ